MRVVTTRNQQVARIDYETDGEAHGSVGSRARSSVRRRWPQRVQAHRRLGLPEGRRHAAAGERTSPRSRMSAACRCSSIRRSRTSTTTPARRSSRRTTTRRRSPRTCASAERPTRRRPRGRSAIARARQACSSPAASTACGCSTTASKGPAGDGARSGRRHRRGRHRHRHARPGARRRRDIGRSGAPRQPRRGHRRRQVRPGDCGPSRSCCRRSDMQADAISRRGYRHQARKPQPPHTIRASADRSRPELPPEGDATRTRRSVASRYHRRSSDSIRSMTTGHLYSRST